jgi:hypothetical protein
LVWLRVVNDEKRWLEERVRGRKSRRKAELGGSRLSKKKTHSKREEGHHGYDENVKLPSNYSRNRALMIRLVGIVVQPHVQRRANRHCKDRKLRCEKADDKKRQERSRLVSSVH